MLKPGDRTQSGKIFCGISESTGAHLFVLPTDEPLKLIWSDAAAKASTFSDTRLPTVQELASIFQNKANIGNLQEGAYWSSQSPKNVPGYAFIFHMNLGAPTLFPKSGDVLNVRLVSNTP